jgi:hypothetical protein
MLIVFYAMAILGLLCFILPGIYFIVMMSRQPNFSRKQAAKRLHLFEHGLLVADHAGPVDAFRWDSMSVLQEIVERYANGAYVGTVYVYTLTRHDGSILKLTHFYADPQQWGAIIQQEITRAQAPAALAALERGQTLQFGDLSVSAGGVATAKRGGVGWHEIQEVNVKNGVLFLKKSGKRLPWSNTQVSKIPNFFIFLAIAQRFQGGEGSGHAEPAQHRH